jgi:hypothetical protein
MKISQTAMQQAKAFFPKQGKDQLTGHWQKESFVGKQAAF